MGEEIKLNKGLYNSHLDNLNTAVTDVEGTIEKNLVFDKTNITPFTNDLENTIKAIELLDRYKQLFIDDIAIFREKGEILSQQDEQLAQNTRNAMHNGNQPMMY